MGLAGAFTLGNFFPAFEEITIYVAKAKLCVSAVISFEGYLVYIINKVITQTLPQGFAEYKHGCFSFLFAFALP